MSQDISEHRISELVSMAKTVVKWIGTHPIYISYIIFFSPYILKLLYFFYPLLILLLATSLCAFSTSTKNSFHVKCNETQDIITSSTPTEVEAYNIIFDNFQESATSSADDSDTTEAYTQTNIQALTPEIVKSCCSSTPLQDPPLHEIVAKIVYCPEDEPSIKAINSEDANSTTCKEAEIIKHMVCITINNQNERKSEDEQQVKSAAEMEINKAEILPFTTTPKSESDESLQSPTPTTDLHKTSRSYDFSTIGSMRREKEWRRTLACKLFEERHNNRSGGEADGMDMLWETLDDESIEIESPKPRDEYRLKTMSKRRSKSAKSDVAIRVCNDEDEEGDDDVAVSGKMCCLQALKISSGKVNLGITNKNMIKFSKVLRGFGWLHKTSSTSNTRK